MKLFFTATTKKYFFYRLWLCKSHVRIVTVLRATGSVKARMVFTAIYQSSKGGHSETRTAATRSKHEHVAWRQR